MESGTAFTLFPFPIFYIKEALISPSIRQNQIKVDVKIQNAGNKSETITLKGDVYRWDGKGRDKAGQWGIKGKALASKSSGKVEIPAGETREITLIYEKPPLETWSPYTPVLYVLELKLEPSGDVLRERFGYRELWTQDGDFYLNGKKVHFLASSWWPPTQGVTREFVLSQLLPLKKMNAVAFRTHTQPWQDIYYEVADEIGLMMIPEAAIWNDDTSYRVFDPKFWENYAQHLRSMVHHLYNHPVWLCGAWRTSSPDRG
jgi:beta-galactosidase/beta-glucuronidase